MPATYRRFVVIDRSAMPSTVISVMLAYNHFKELGIARDSMFLEPVLSHIDDWVLNKRYTREEIDALVGTNDLSVFITPAMMDTNSSVSHRMMAALDGDNLCKGWTPRSDESLMLVHHTLDGAVPVENTLNLIAFRCSGGRFRQRYGNARSRDWSADAYQRRQRVAMPIPGHCCLVVWGNRYNIL